MSGRADASDPGSKARVFFALPLGGELGGRAMELVLAALGGERRAREEHRLPRSEGLHLTLFFVGELERDRLRALWERALAELAGAPRPHLAIDHAGAFPRPGHERVLWLGVRERDHPGRLGRLVEGVLAAARGAGLDTSAEDGRPFRPHVTIARPRRRRPAVPEAFYALAPGLEWTPGELLLLESVRAPSGPPVYEPRERLELPPG